MFKIILFCLISFVCGQDQRMIDGIFSYPDSVKITVTYTPEFLRLRQQIVDELTNPATHEMTVNDSIMLIEWQLRQVKRMEAEAREHKRKTDKMVEVRSKMEKDEKESSYFGLILATVFASGFVYLLTISE